MRYRYKKAINLLYDRQAYIYYHCLNYNRLSLEHKKQIEQTCVEVGGHHYGALLDFMTRGMGIQALRIKNAGIYENGGNFYPLVHKFYEIMDGKI